jgi:two-component system response regulator MprA
MTTILIADDEAPIRELLTDALIDEGYRVVTVDDGLAALDQIVRECPALVITDNMMPRLSGTALIARLRAAPISTPPVLLMSAVPPAQAPPVPFLAKPFDLGNLFTLVHSLAGAP